MKFQASCSHQETCFYLAGGKLESKKIVRHKNSNLKHLLSLSIEFNKFQVNPNQNLQLLYQPLSEYFIKILQMAQYSSIIKELEASRRLASDLTLEKHHQELEKSKIERELENLRRSRKNYIDAQIAQSNEEYQKKLAEDNDISEEHLNRQKKAAKERAKIAQQDFQRERERLIAERNEHDCLDKEYRVVDKDLLDLQTKSKIAQEDEDRKLFELNARKKVVLKLLEESKQRELYHYEQAKRLIA